jgi:ATP-dependent RNA helicase DeaD
VPDRQTAYDVAGIVRASGGTLTPLTVASRATTLLQRNPTAIVGTPADLLALVRTSALKLENVRHVVLLWADSIVEKEPQANELDTLLGETARDGDRTLIVEQQTPAVEALIERAALKPRRLTHEPAPASQRTVSYLLVAPEQRGAMLQRLLDAREATTVALVAESELAAQDARAAVSALGMDVPADVQVLQPPDTVNATLVVWYGPPASLERIAALLAPLDETAHVVLLATPSELQRLRSYSAVITLIPENLPQGVDEAAQRQRLLRDEISAVLRREPIDGELLLLEPLLAQHSAPEIAAATLRMLGRARLAAARAERAEVPATAPVTRAPSSAAPTDQHWTRLFLSVGERDGARRGDLVGAITGEAGITGSQIGKIEMRETYSLVDVATPVAEKVVERLTGVSVRGRRVTARLDRGGGRSGPADARRGPGRREDSEGYERGGRAEPRAAREHEEWSSRAERLRHSRRPPGGSEP